MATVEVTEVRCPSCGRMNPAGNRFCGNCGTTLPSVVAEATEAPSVTPAEPSAPVVAPPVVPVAVAPVITPPAAPTITIPSDPIARERERDRLLTLANVQRMRGQVTDARLTVEQALALTEGENGKALSPIHELRGDLLATEEKWEEALAAYNSAHQLDPKRASAEKKFAEVTLQMARAKSPDALGEAILKGDSIADLLTPERSGKRNAGVAMMLSMFVPGFGQFYNGQIVKGLIVLGIFCFCLLIIALSPDKNALFYKLASLLAMAPGKGARMEVSPFLVIFGLLAFASWIYSVADAPFNANKTVSTTASGEIIDKTGWEV